MLRRVVVFVAVLALVGVTAWFSPASAHSYHHHHHHHKRHHHSDHSSSSSDTNSGDSGSAGDGASTTESNDDSSVSDKDDGSTADGMAVTPDATTPAMKGSIPTGSEQTITANLTGFSFQDNTPPGSSTISMPILHKVAGGTGTFADPITTAVPGHAGSGVETPKGTRLYVAKLKRYFIVEDSGATKESTKHFDLWVGGQGFTKSQSDKCESSYTGKAPVILNPPAGEPVTPGQLTGANGCKI